MNKYVFDAENWDIIVKTSDNQLLRCHKCILYSISDYFKNAECDKETVMMKLNVRSQVIEPFIENMYNIFNKKSINVSDEYRSDDYIDMLLFIDSIKINISTQNLKDEIIKMIIKKHYHDWIDFLNNIYIIKSLSDVVEQFIKTYSEDINHELLREMDYNIIKSISDNELRDKLLSCHFEKNKINTRKNIVETNINKNHNRNVKNSNNIIIDNVNINVNSPVNMAQQIERDRLRRDRASVILGNQSTSEHTNVINVAKSRPKTTILGVNKHDVINDINEIFNTEINDDDNVNIYINNLNIKN